MTVVRKIVTIAMALSVAWGATGCAPTNSTAQPAESEAVEENPYGGFPVDLPAADKANPFAMGRVASLAPAPASSEARTSMLRSASKRP